MSNSAPDYHAADDEARRRIATRLDDNLFVEAGAGTGKTRALVDRYVALVAAGRRVEELVAITFTEKAAAELRDRVRAELEERISKRNGDVETLVRARDGLDRAQISTIHAFCANVLRSFAAEAGIDPSFKVEDQVAAERRFEERWVSHLEHLSDDTAAHEAFSRIMELGLTTRDLEKLARELWGNPALAQRLAERPLSAPAVVWPDLTGLQRELAELQPERVSPADKLLPSVIALQHVLRGLIETPADERHTRLVAELASLKVSSAGQQGNWTNPGGVVRARQVVKEIAEELKSTLDQLRAEALGRFMPFVVRFAAVDIGVRCASGSLMFEDLILQVRDILTGAADARRRLRARYRAMLIDEYQDTDPAQTDIALAFAADPDTGVFDGGRLFLVGDPKQSIYRFRRADMVIYSNTRRLLKDKDGGEERLALNRRSRKDVLNFVNGVFAGLIGEGGDPQVQPAYADIHHDRAEEVAGPGVGLLGGQIGGLARDMRNLETAQIAAYCRAALEQGWQVVDRDSKAVRPAKYGDIAILVPTRTTLAPLERALGDAGVPYRVEGGSLVYATQEVRDLINCLAAIDDPADEVAVAGALRSPAYACSDVDLARHKLEARGSFDYLDTRLQPGIGRVADALLDLRDYHALRGHVSLAALTERFIAAHRSVEAGLYTSGSRDAFRRARFVIEQARLFEAEQPESLRAFVEWLSRRASDAILDYEGAGLDDDEDAVRILTIHAAKGLEFPIVFLAGLSVSPSNQDSTYMVDRTTDEVAVSIGSASRNNKSTLGPYADVVGRERAHEAAERIRLLYVAATRARDHLIVSLFHNEKARNTHAQTLTGAGVRDLAAALPELPPVTGAATGPFEGLAVDAVAETEEQFAERRAALVQSARGQRVSSATALGKLDDGADGEEEREDETEPWARGRAGTHRGRAVHAALQVLPWDADATTIDALADAQAVAETIPGERAEVARLLRRAFGTDAAGRARSARRALREVPFAFLSGGVLLEGFIDLVIEAEDGSMEVVDWKTDAVPESAVEARLEGYRLQAGLYVLGLESATGRRVSRVTYVFVTPGCEVSPGAPAALAELAQERIATFAASAG